MAASFKVLSFVIFCTLFSIFILSCAGTRKAIFSTKTSYHWVIDPDKTVQENEQMRTEFGGKKCVAVRVETMLRHGARQPGYKDIRKMTELHQKLKLTVTNKKFQFLNDWENHFPEHEEKNLVDAGEEEQFGIGLRFGKRLNKLFSNDMSSIKFISSSKDRAKESAHAFYEGLTEAVLHEAQDNLLPEIRDDLLRFHTHCGQFIETVENNRTYLREYVKFKVAPLMNQVSESLAERLGMEHARLDAGELKLVYFLCTFEMIIFERDDWCLLLIDEEREILEYHNDLKQYWKKAYGHPIIGKMACPLVENIFRNMDKTIESILNNMKRRGDVATFYFGHAETLFPLYAALGLFNDSTPLLSTNYEQMKNRKFKSSQILPFSGNIALVLYDCNNGVGSQNSEPSAEKFVIRVYVNEQPQVIPACDDYVCRYTDVRDSYKHHVDHCDFHSSCSLTKHDEL